MWNLSIVIIVPSHLQDKANRLSCALGHDVLPGNTFSVPLSDNGEDVTHYGCRTAAKQEFVDILQSASEGELPEDFEQPLEDVQEVMAAMIMDVRPSGNDAEHFDEVCATEGLSRVTSQDY